MNKFVDDKMSWFRKVRSESKASRKSSDASSHQSGEFELRTRRDTDPQTCLEVFRNHWEQAFIIIRRDAENGAKTPTDELESVRMNFEQMVTLLADEEGEPEGQGMPGPILHFLLEHEILEKFCGWCHRNNDETGKLTKEQLRMFEHLISHSLQLLLIHKPVIRPILNLLAFCADGFSNRDIEPNLVLFLHQICISISKETVILESFFNTNADHGATKFLIFSLLIPFLHRDGAVGQQARDALLLIMTLSAKHPEIGKYIAENSDFCPVLATGLSGLYSDLPRKFEVPTEDWYCITDEESANIPEMAMFLNSLGFCNAVVQIAHPLVRDQLIQFIYNGFLVPVLAPALHQNSREEVITTTAYLDLFLRKITEPALLKTFFMFIFLERNDEIIILDSLITRINSSSKLSLVSLSLFHTLVDMNCEDVMFDLVFRHLIPCSHVMISQRQSVRELDMYTKSAEKFLSLRPTCCLPEIGESPVHSMGDLPGLPKITNNKRQNLPKFLQARRGRRLNKQIPSVSKEDIHGTSFPPGSFGSKLEHFESSYLSYLLDARQTVRNCAVDCQVWLYRYDGEDPPCDCLETDKETSSDSSGKQVDSEVEESSAEQRDVNIDVTDKCGSLDKSGKTPYSKSCVCDIKSDLTSDTSAIDFNEETQCNEASVDSNVINDSKYETMDEFLSMLDESNAHVDRTVTIEDSFKSLDSVLSNLSVSMSKTSTPRKDMSREKVLNVLQGSGGFSSDFCDSRDISSVYEADDEAEKSQVEPTANATSFEVIDSIDSIALHSKGVITNITEFEVLSVPESQFLNNDEIPADKTLKDDTTFVEVTVPDKSSNMQISENVNKSESSSSSNSSQSMLTANSECERIENWYSDPRKKGQGDGIENTNISNGTNEQTYGKTSSKGTEGILVRRDSTKGDNVSKAERKASFKGDKSVRFAGTTFMQNKEQSSRPVSGVLNTTKLTRGQPPSIGPFLTALLLKLESMMQNSLPVNLMLTGLIARLAAYCHPLLRSFLLNQNLVFQPTVKSLVQVLTTVRQKVDHYSYSIHNFELLLLRARRTLAQREGLLPDRGHSLTPSPEMVHTKMRSSTIADLPSNEKRHRSLSEMLFRRNPTDRKVTPFVPSKPGSKIELIAGNKGFRYLNKKPGDNQESQVESTKTKNAVYCAIVLEEFVKELAALTQEHMVLNIDDDGYSSC